MATISTTLGTNPELRQEGPFVFRLCIKTEEKHPWDKDIYKYVSNGENFLSLYSDLDTQGVEGG